MSIYNYSVKNQKGEDFSLSNYKGKVLLIVNTATKCGFTKQYGELEALYEKYNEQGFEILDFPCNQFFHQAPGNDEEINTFCSLNFGTKFPRFKKIEVNGENADPLFVYLCKQNPEGKLKKVKWNFTKFLIGRDGEFVERFEPTNKPSDFEDKIAKELAK
jgi:glutathione peroxidase